MEPHQGAGWTPHNVEVKRQYSEYFEREVLFSRMEKNEVDTYIQELVEAVEANDGEAKRLAAATEAAAEAGRAATTYKEAVQQVGMVVALDEKGKGNGKNSSFPKIHAPHRFNGCPQPSWNSESINAANALLASKREATGQE